ncbi:Protein of unknown function [Pyronema omphalodes CBS 100304]|uniref:F-box domain-containing protein n=1 Tax=Pyronema omphalodes (strain CBS 100304) TaxID=1076935 RepID=U4LWN3_PYROM|nr:Protein of unknown function [Pyronema omphalodes CBS 100304]
MHDITRQQPPPQPPLILAPISVPCEILFHILSFCSPGTLGLGNVVNLTEEHFLFVRGGIRVAEEYVTF